MSSQVGATRQLFWARPSFSLRIIHLRASPPHPHASANTYPSRYPRIMQVVFPEIEPRARMDNGSGPMTEAEFFDFCAQNSDLRIERDATGEIIIMPGTGGETGYRNSILTAQLTAWSQRDGRGRAFDSGTLFLLPNGAARSPDASWVPKTRLDRLTKEEKKRFMPLCPDFVVELISPSD